MPIRESYLQVRAGMNRTSRLAMVVGTILLGAVGGLVLSYVILSFCFSIGRTGYSGSEISGDQSRSLALMIAVTAGGPIGGLIYPLGYFNFLTRVPVPWALVGPASGALIGGLLGGLGGPGLAAVMAVIGFFAACIALSRRDFEIHEI